MRYRTICTSLLLGIAIVITAQPRQENLLLLTDRGHYMSGETIEHRVFYRKPAGSGEADWSRVLYVELITPNGTPLVQSKISLDAAGAAGRIKIPEGLSSGTYYLKVYTRWQRNCGPEGFVYTSVRIYDSFNESALVVDSSGWDPVSAQQLLLQPDMHSDGMLECYMEGSTFGTRKAVVMEMEWKVPDAPIDVTITVSKTGLHGNQEYFGTGCLKDVPDAPGFLPENMGLSLTGQAVSSSNGMPAPYATIYLTMLGTDRDLFCNYSDSAGRFFFSFPGYSGSRDLFVSTYHAEYSDLELLIDRDFSQDVIQLPSYPVRMNDSLTETITEMSVNAQISNQYYPEQIAEPVQDSAGELLFYGHPMSTVYFDDFIRLPRLEEYFIEVVPQVSVRKSQGITRLILLGEHPDLEIYPPLLMIDGVAIFDLEAVLAVSPRLIERVEIVNALYIRGNVTFGGIISLISKNNDLGYIDLPSSGLLVNYQMLDLPGVDTIQNGVLDPRLPDVRNTLYWNPGLKLDAHQSECITFSTSDLKGAYEILIRGTDSTGKFLEKRVPFRVE
ncbi:MAG: hypothetical protein K8R52_03665 [Bacteroidales bacterium]|nr:hypothetical protein [Bacteroidales bacterium]